VITGVGADGIDVTDLRSKTGSKNVPAVERRAAINELLTAGFVKAEIETTGGRSRMRLRLTRFALPTGSGQAAERAERAERTAVGPTSDMEFSPSALNAPNALNASTVAKGSSGNIRTIDAEVVL